MRLLFAAALLVTAQAASLGAEKCTWGPSYWCSSVPAATRCSAFAHCLDTQWKHQLLDVEQTDLCAFSQKMVETVRHVLTLSNGQDQATHLLASTCSYIKDSSERQECKLLVKKYLPQVFKLINTDIPKYQPPTNKTICTDCRTFVGDLRTLISQEGSKDRFLKVMDDICSDFGPLDILCKAYVDSTMPSTFDFIADNDSQLLEEEEDIPCNDCRKTMTSVLAFDKDSHFRVRSKHLFFLKMAVEKAFAFICSLTTLGEQKCHSLSETLPSDFAAFVSRHVDAESVCTETLRCIEDEDSTEVMATARAPVPTDFCGDCQKFFGDVKAVLRNKYSAPEATALAKQIICQEVGPLEFECNAILEAGMPTILDLLAQEDNPDKVCAALTLCPKRADVSKFDLVKAFDAAWEKKSLGDFKCDECAVLVQDARDLDRDPDVQKGIETFLNDICGELGQDEQKRLIVTMWYLSQCKDLVKQYSPQLFQIIASELEPEVVCELLLRCTKPELESEEDFPAATVVTPDTVLLAVDPTEPTPSEYFVKKSKKNSSVECAICRLAMEVLDARIADNRTEESVMNELEGLCNLLPSTVKEPCDQFIQEYTPAIVDLLLQELDPLLVCDELQVCDNGTESHYSFTAPASEPEEVTEKPTAEEVLEVVRMPESSIECQICQLVVGTVDSIIGENRTEAAIQQALDDICNILPSGIRPQCLSFVNEYASVVIELLLQELDPDEVCVNIGLCDNSTELDYMLGDNRSEPAIENALDKVCTLFPDTISTECENFVNTYAPAVINLLIQELDPKSPAVESALDRVCNLLPDTISAECQSFINTYAPAVVHLLIEEMDPKRICKELGLCDSKPATAEVDLPHTEKTAPQDDLECELCHAIITEINKIIGDDRSEEAIIRAVEVVCDVVSGDLKIQCKSEIENYGPAVLDLLQHMDDPNTVCRALKVCPASQKTRHSPTAVKTGEVCLVCQTLATYAGEALNEQSTVDEVTKLMEDVCGVLPTDFRSECDTVVDQFAPMIIKLLADKYDPLQVCQALELCSKENSSSQPDLLGVDACTFGPAYWCANMDNARKCKAVDHCIKNYDLKP
ncbi:hypothetical protein BaRGS_00002347 [Batillaria attramentaria]|uniref:Saposin n=1 Tax=Batillaria attramentaria TaxID=370345 RepID=A0ABD0M420_9CAEN